MCCGARVCVCVFLRIYWRKSTVDSAPPAKMTSVGRVSLPIFQAGHYQLVCLIVLASCSMSAILVLFCDFVNVGCISKKLIVNI